MKKYDSRNFPVLIVGVIVMTSAVGYSLAQKRDGDPKTSVVNMSNMSNDQANARQEIAKSVSGSLVLDAITVKEPDWALARGSHSARVRGESSQQTALSFRKNSLSLHISISEFDSIEGAEASFSLPRSHGAAVPFQIGDRGEKVYSQSGRMVGLNFRVGNYMVNIGGTGEEKLEEAFARHVLEAIKGLASK